MLQIPQCFNCKHFDEEKAKEKEHIYRCNAFPNKIPKEFLEFNETDLFSDDLPEQKAYHNKIIAEQNGSFIFERVR